MRAVDTVRRTREKLRPFVPGSKTRLVVLCAAAAISGVAEAGLLVLIVQLAVAIATDGSVSTDELGPLDLSLSLSISETFGVALGLMVVKIAFFVTGAYLAARLSADALTRLRKDIFRRFLGASWDLQSGEREGHLQELLSTHVIRVALAILFVASSLTALLNFLVLMGSALLLNPVAAGAIFVAVALLVFALRPISRRSRRHSLRGSHANIEFVNSVAESVSMAQEVATFGVGPAVRRRVDGLIDEASAPFFRNRFLGKMLPGLYQTAASLLILVALASVAALGAAELTSLGAVVLILLRSLAYSQQMQTTYHQINDLVPYAEQLLERRASYSADAAPSGSQSLDRLDELRFDDVSFAYRRDEPVLRDVTFAVGQGEIIGMVGPSGSGKSTLLQLLLRLRAPQQGRYTVNGVDVNEYSLASWRQRFAFVAQESRLFGGTVAENIRFFRDDISDAAIEEAARQAHVHDDIVSWPLGYQTAVGTRGGAISGGQRQRISLARALAGHPEVILLDEPTSALDMRSEALVRATLLQLKGKVTVFIVAHRLSTVGDCDRIMVLEDGVLQSFDAPRALVESNTFYQEATRLTELG